MPIQIVRNDITRMHVDAIVNAANESLLGGGGVDGAIHRAAGPQLLAQCRTLGGCKTGEAKITMGYRLPSRYVIHTVGPVWHGGTHGEREKLASCYRESLKLAKAHDCQSVAFPMISTGVYGYPKDQAMRVAMDTISAFLLDCDMMVYVVVFDRKSFQLGGKLFAGVQQYIDDHYVQEHTDPDRESRRMQVSQRTFFEDEACCESMAMPCGAPMESMRLEDALMAVDESFSQMVLRMIDEKGMKDAECYKRANMDRKHFSKLRGDPQYRPKKTTAVALAIALELSLDQTRELLMKAGYALSRSSRFDIIIEYCITHGIYNIHTVNELLFGFDQMTLGA